MNVETINQFGEEYSLPPEFTRIGCRAIIVENGRILLSYEVNTGVYLSPGGGLEEGETLEECCIREIREETGIEVKPLKHFITIDEHCFETVYNSNYFICEKTGESKPSLTETEIEHGITAVWVSIDEALEIFGAYASKREDIASLYLREFTVINEYIKAKHASQ